MNFRKVVFGNPTFVLRPFVCSATSRSPVEFLTWLSKENCMLSDFRDYVFDLIDSDDADAVKIKAGVSTVAGGLTGGATVAVTGMTAAGMVGGGAGVGCAAGPLGVVAGAVVGLAAYGAYRIFS
jgi:hypothetical protein